MTHKLSRAFDLLALVPVRHSGDCRRTGHPAGDERAFGALARTRK